MKDIVIMPKTEYRIPEAGETVALDVPPRLVGLHKVADVGDLFVVMSTTIDDGGLYVTVHPSGERSDSYRLSADHVSPVD